jgi:hypothetical protein
LHFCESPAHCTVSFAPAAIVILQKKSSCKTRRAVHTYKSNMRTWTLGVQLWRVVTLAPPESCINLQKAEERVPGCRLLLLERWRNGRIATQPAPASSLHQHKNKTAVLRVQVEFPPAARSLPADLRDRDNDTGDGEAKEMSLRVEDNSDTRLRKSRASPCGSSCRATCVFSVERCDFLFALLAARGERDDALFGDVELVVSIDRSCCC